MKYFITLLLTLVLVTGCAHNALEGNWNVQVGDSIEIPYDTLLTKDREFAKSGLRYILFFGTFCPPCREELKYLIDYNKKTNNSELQNKILLISYGEDSDTVMNYLDSSQLPFPVILDEEAKFAEKIGGDFIPRGLLIDSNHIVVDIIEGFDQEKVDEILAKIK